MKTRHGFVSNSSSSSFMVMDSSLHIADLAYVMIALREWENDAKLMQHALEMKKYLPEECGIAFHTCNYETYIYRDDAGWIQVRTCNNHDWGLLDINTAPLYEDAQEEIPYGTPFYWLEHCTLVPYGPWYCSKCWCHQISPTRGVPTYKHDYRISPEECMTCSGRG
jgi:hypothetical protein